jgi:hypothetical protein
MSSFPEQKAEKFMLQDPKFFLWYHQVSLYEATTFSLIEN